MKTILKQLEEELLDSELVLTSEITPELVVSILNNKSIRRAFTIALVNEAILFSQILQHGNDKEKKRAILEHEIPCIEIRNYHMCLHKRSDGNSNYNYTKAHC